MATKIKHLAISSANTGSLRDFYTDLFRLRSDTAGIGGQALSDGYVGLNVNRRGKGRQAGIDHFGLEVEDADALMARSKAAYPKINFLKRPSNRPFAGIGTHDPAGNVFDLSQPGMDNRKGVYAEAPEEWQPRHINHFQLRALDPEMLAEFYQEIYGLRLEPRRSEDPTYALTDGHVTLVIAPWNIQDYSGTGIERPAIDHLGFGVESLTAFKVDLDQLMESRPDLFPTYEKANTEGARRLEILATCHRGELQLSDPDGVLLDVNEV